MVCLYKAIYPSLINAITDESRVFMLKVIQLYSYVHECMFVLNSNFSFYFNYNK